MKPKWKDEEIKSLLKFVEEGNKKNIPLLTVFKEFAKRNNRQPFSVRNFYYSCVKMISDDTHLQKKFDFNPILHQISNFQHFEKEDEIILKNKIDNMVKNGISVRKACEQLAEGDIKKALRIQNKYRSLTKKDVKIYQFPNTNKINAEKIKLTDEDIKSLFMGLVNLVKENAKSDNQQKFEAFLQKTEEDKRRHLVQLEQKQFEIDRLNQSINELKAKNMALNKTLENYRIDYLNNNPSINA